MICTSRNFWYAFQDFYVDFDIIFIFWWVTHDVSVNFDNNFNFLNLLHHLLGSQDLSVNQNIVFNLWYHSLGFEFSKFSKKRAGGGGGGEILPQKKGGVLKIGGFF